MISFGNESSMNRLKSALVVACVATALAGTMVGSAWAQEPGVSEPPPGSGVSKGLDQYDEAGELVGGSVVIPPGVNTGPGGGGYTVRHNVRAYPGGGAWDYGTTSASGWSNYYHRDRHHGATTTQGSRSARADRGPGVWANTSLSRDPFGPAMRSFWRWN